MIEKQNKFIVFFKNLVHRVLKHDLSTMAASLSYYFLSASIPLMLVLTTLVGKYLGGNKELLLELVQLLPGQTQEIVMSM
ncbi:MAG: YhjD/YihY/BrkB family envelope integrity protein, partial [Anaerococcus sp.]